MSGSKIKIEDEITEAILERPCGFSIGYRRFHLFPAIRRFHLYPMTLGKAILLSSIVKELGIDMHMLVIIPYIQLLQIVAAHKEEACRIIAYSVAPSKKDIFNTKRINQCKSFFLKILSDIQIAQLLIAIFRYDHTTLFIKHLGLDREQKEQAKISNQKNKNGNTVTFGGKSMYGSLLSVACEKYGWTLDYVVWGISLVNLRMMLADSINSVYLSDDEKKSVRLTVGQEVVSMDDPKNWDKIKSMKWD